MTYFPNALAKEHRLHEYEIVRVLGVGGFGVTYLALDDHLNKPVAIKEYLPNDLAVRVDGTSVHPKSSSDRDDFQWGLDRFLDEARTLARFDHPSIIRVYRFFKANDTAYIVMEYAEGETLAAHLRDHGLLDEDELKAILWPLLDGLEQVHKADLLHRDIKPDNIILRADGSPVLIDFGAARQQVIGRSRSVTSIITAGYSPFEQYSTRSDQGPWTDIYALGAVCYTALTGDKPPDAADRIRSDAMVPATAAATDRASPRFLEAVDQALSVFESSRPQGIAHWRAMIQGQSAGPVDKLPAEEMDEEDHSGPHEPPQFKTERPPTETLGSNAKPKSESKRKWRYLPPALLLSVIAIGIIWITGGLLINTEKEEERTLTEQDILSGEYVLGEFTSDGFVQEESGWLFLKVTDCPPPYGENLDDDIGESIEIRDHQLHDFDGDGREEAIVEFRIHPCGGNRGGTMTCLARLQEDISAVFQTQCFAGQTEDLVVDGNSVKYSQPENLPGDIYWGASGEKQCQLQMMVSGVIRRECEWVKGKGRRTVAIHYAPEDAAVQIDPDSKVIFQSPGFIEFETNDSDFENTVIYHEGYESHTFEGIDFPEQNYSIELEQSR